MHKSQSVRNRTVLNLGIKGSTDSTRINSTEKFEPGSS